ncbi:MAG: dihydrodipicolinate synthase family protein, partial [Thermoplasmata archaeon]
MEPYRGVFTPVISPIKNGDPDRDAIRSMIAFQKRIKTDGILAMGTTGMFPMFSIRQHKDILRIYSEERDKLKFFAGVSKNSFEDTVDIANYAKDLQPDALVLMTPYYTKMGQESIFAYYSEFLKKFDENLIIYNFPSMSGNSISPETVLKLTEEFDSIKGIKDSSSDFSSFSMLISLLRGKISIFQGNDGILLPSLKMGSSGTIGALSNFSDIPRKVYDYYASGNYEMSERYSIILQKLKDLANSKPSPVVYHCLFYA